MLRMDDATPKNEGFKDDVKATLDQVFTSWHADHERLRNRMPHPLAQLALHWIESQEWWHLDLCHGTLHRFLRRIEDHYSTELPYHNLLHAMSVTHITGMLLSADGAEPLLQIAGARDAEILRLATFLAAIVHDTGHKGVTNDFLAATNDEYALDHGDEHTHERAHLAITFRAFRAFPFIDLHGPEFTLLRRAMTSLVLDTDMVRHSHVMATFASAHSLMMSRSAVPFGRGGLSCLSMLAILLKSADLAHMAAPWDLHVSWVHRLRDEMFLQGDLERQRGWEVASIYDRGGRGILAVQVSFFTVVVLPMYQALTLLIPGAQPLLDGARANSLRWTPQ